MSATLTVVSVGTLHRDALGSTVDVFCKGPRGGEINYVVQFDRRHRLHCAYRHTPNPGYVPAAEVPANVEGWARAKLNREEAG